MRRTQIVDIVNEIDCARTVVHGKWLPTKETRPGGGATVRPSGLRSVKEGDMSNSRSRSALITRTAGAATASQNVADEVAGKGGARPSASGRVDGEASEVVRLKRRPRGKVAAIGFAAPRSFVVELTPIPEGRPGVIARIEPTPDAAAELIGQGFELSDSIFDLVSDLLVEIAREDEGEEKDP